MKFGVTLLRVHYASAARVARKAEALGYESIWTGEHLIWPVEFAPNYPYGPDGKPPNIRTDIPTMDCWVLLATVAAATSTIRVGTDVYILPLRDPLVTARAAMSLDVLSGGRLNFGVGAGWLAEEFTYTGIDYHTRGRRMDECLEVIERLWRDDTPSFSGEFFNIGPVKFEPKPVQRPRPPILVGGESRAALRRAADRTDGWIGIQQEPERIAELVRRLQAYRADSAKAREPLDISVLFNGGPSAEEIDRYRQVGVTRLVISPFARTREAEEGLERYAEQVLQRQPPDRA